MVKISFNRSSPYDPVFNPVKWNDAAISYHQPIVVLMNVSKVLEGSENKKEVIPGLLFNMAPLIDKSCNFSTMDELGILSQNPSNTPQLNF